MDWNYTALGNGLVVSEGDFWLRQRRMIQPHFHRKQLAGLTEAMVAATAEGLESWQQAAAKQPFDVLPGFSAITMRVIARALFGQGLAHADLERVSQVMAFAIDYLMTGTFTYSLPRWLPIPGARHYREAVQEFDALIAKIIAHESAADTPSDSLLAMLVAEEIAKRHKHAWVPFGMGQRQCIGKDFSLMEAQIILAMVMQRYTFTAASGAAIRPKLSSTLKPDGGVPVRLEPRAA